MACRLVGAKPLSEPILEYLNPKEHNSVGGILTKLQHNSVKS